MYTALMPIGYHWNEDIKGRAMVLDAFGCGAKHEEKNVMDGRQNLNVVPYQSPIYLQR